LKAFRRFGNLLTKKEKVGIPVVNMGIRSRTFFDKKSGYSLNVKKWPNQQDILWWEITEMR
jgi:hypothetical protein